MAFDVNNFIIDRVVRGIALSQKDDSVLFSINQIQNPSLSCTSESTDAVDALGTPIARFFRSKTCEFTAENAILDLNLMATQLGTSKKVASTSEKIIVPAMESFTVAEGLKYELKHTPKSEVKEIYALNGDSTFGTKYTKSSAADAEHFSIADKTISLPTGLEVGADMFVMYEYETDKAVEVVNSATQFPVGCKFIMEVLGCDVCDQTSLIYAFVIFDNAKISPDFDISFATDTVHNFSLQAMQDYCSKEKKLFSIVVPGDVE